MASKLVQIKSLITVFVVTCLLGLACATDCPANCHEEWGQGACNVTSGDCSCTRFYAGDDCSISNDTIADWDNIDCHHGGRLFPPYEHDGFLRWCICPYGWNGLDCSLCAFDDVCAPVDAEANHTWVCDRSIFMHQKKSYNCTVTSEGLNSLVGGNGIVVVACEMPENKSVDGTCAMDLYLRQTGVPKLFGCQFKSCSRASDQSHQKIHCLTSECQATSWANAIVAGIVAAAKTTADFACDNRTNVCSFVQAELEPILDSIQLSCNAAECMVSVIPVPVRNVTPLMAVIISGAGAIVLAALFGYACYVTMKKYHKQYRPLPHIEATISFHNISCTLTKKGHPERRVLHDVSGNALPGNVTAIIGSSGAGKTTFLDILAGRKNTGVVSGDIFINGEPRTKAFKRLAGYVTQDDVFLGTLTVQEYLMYNAMLRLPPHMTKEQKAAKVAEVLLELGISHIASSRIGTEGSRGISGGERKRLAIAAELIVDPSILILDEPTSGLDSFSASSLISTLSNLAHGAKKRTIILSIHQPRSDIFHKFDYLMVLAKGRLVYYGQARGAVDYFATLGYVCPQNFNPADFIIDTVANTSFTDNMSQVAPTFDDLSAVQHVSSKGNAGTMSKELGGVEEYASPFWVQFQVLTQRTFLNVFRNPFLFKIQYTVTIVVGLLLGYLYWHVPNDLQHGGMQNRMGALFFMCALLSFSSITSIDLFFSERLLFLRERANGCYRTSAYFLAKAVSDLLPMRVLPPLMLGCIVYYMIGFNPYYVNFLYFLVVLVLVSMTATAMCFVISSITPSVSVGNLVAILLLFFFLLFGGFLVNTTNMSEYVRWITKLSFLTYGFTALMINEFRDITILINPGGEYSPTLVPGTVILAQVGMDPRYFNLDIILLACMLVAFLALAYILLRYFVKERR